MAQLTDTTRAALEELLETSLRATPTDWQTIRLKSAVIGYVYPSCEALIREYLAQDGVSGLAVFGQHLQLDDLDPFELSQRLELLAQFLRKKDCVPGWRDEAYAWVDEYGMEHFRMERAVFRVLGLHSRACHINGYTRDQKLWLGKRSPDKATDPNMLDNLAAGGMAADETIYQCVLRELWEEAGIDPEISRHTQPIGHIHVRRIVENKGLHDESLYTHDLLMPDEYEPANQDGEVSGFQCVSFTEAADLILAGELTPDAAAVTADFLLRHTR